eukprot:COSAG02_NODE_1884_length_10516_cov_4.173466_9_plen_139_part_00
MFRSLVYNETKAAQLWARSEALVQNAMNKADRVRRSLCLVQGSYNSCHLCINLCVASWSRRLQLTNVTWNVNLQAPYTWDDPMKIMNGNQRDRFEAAAAVHAEMAAGSDEGMGELGFLKHDAEFQLADSENPTGKQDL